MKFSYNWLSDYIVGKMPEPKRLAELLTFHSFEIEELKKVGTDWLIDIKILPNRAHDCLSHLGIAREIAAIANLKLKIKNQKLKIKDDGLVNIKIENSQDCPRYTALVIKDIKVGESPKWLRERLKLCGLQAINNIVDITNYVMLETGQPMHVFDADKIGVKNEFSIFNFQFSNKAQNSNLKKQEKQIIVRRARKGEGIITLDNKQYTLDESILVIADEEKPIAIAGIKGGMETGIDQNTKNIVIEAANFNPILIRRVSQKLKLRTDASWRFENKISPELIDYSQARVAGLIQELAGGQVVSGLAEVYPQKPTNNKVKLDLSYASRLLGFDVNKAKTSRILRTLGFQVKPQGASLLLVEAPFWRLDISSAEDLVEEIGRLIGYENIPADFPKASLNPPAKNMDWFWQSQCQNILQQQGFSEAYSYSFLGEQEKETFSLKELAEPENPISALNKYLRPSLLPGLLKNVKNNSRFHNEVKLFELGSVFSKEGDGLVEQRRLAGVLSDSQNQSGFYNLKGALENLFGELAVVGVKYLPYNQDLVFHPGQTAEIVIKEKRLGLLGQIHPKVAEALELKDEVFVFELDLAELLKRCSQNKEYQPIPSYPATLRDLAVLAPQGTATADIFTIIKQAGSPLVTNIELFEVYSGHGVPAGQENQGFHIVYQAADKTLTAQEVDIVQQKIIKALAEKGWEVRK